ncbi:hypothetical protein HDU99_000221, partial [Rhizoclosmatium hyalinum]
SKFKDPDTVFTILKRGKTIPEVLKDIQGTGKDFAVYTKYNLSTCSGDSPNLFAYAGIKDPSTRFEYQYANKTGKIEMTFWIPGTEIESASHMNFEIKKCENSGKWTIAPSVKASGGYTASVGILWVLFSLFVF